MSGVGAVLLTALLDGPALGQGFTDGHVTFYGQVRQVGGAGAVLLQAGRLELAIANQRNADNRITLTTDLNDTGTLGCEQSVDLISVSSRELVIRLTPFLLRPLTGSRPANGP
jgi:hypothetical protein